MTTLGLAFVVCLTVFVGVHFLVVLPLQGARWLFDYRMRHPAVTTTVAVMLYTLIPSMAAFIVLVRSSLFRHRGQAVRAWVLYLISWAFLLGVVAVLIVVLGVAFNCAMSQKHGGDF